MSPDKITAQQKPTTVKQPVKNAPVENPLPSLMTFKDSSWGSSASCKFPTTDNKYKTAYFRANIKGAAQMDISVFESIAAESKGNRADIDNTYQLTEKIYKAIPENMEQDNYASKRLAQYDRLMKHYTDPGSPGGAKFTQQEQRAFMEIWTDSFCQ